MSRRDTIIIAVLINAGLLVILFATAMNSNDSASKDAGKPTQQLAQAQGVQPPQEKIQAFATDEVDQAISRMPPTDNSPLAAQTPASTQQPLATSSATITPVNLTEQLATSDDASTDDTKVAKADTSTKNYVEVTVKKGDILERIARNNGTTVQDIMKANKLMKTNLHIGQVLRIPKGDASQTQVATTTPSKPQDKKATATASPDTVYYIVKSGDNPSKIASKNRIKLDDLLRLNDLDEASARRLKPGDRIRIR